MPRDANGNYTLPAGNPVLSGTVIESAWANALTSDLAIEMTDSLSRSGKGGFTGPVRIVDSDGAIPGLAFVNEPTSGLKRTAAGDVRMQIQSDDRMRWRVGAAQRPEVQDSGVWKPVALEEAGQKIMRGEGGVTIIFSHNNTAAPGWSIEEPDANIRELVIGPAAGGGAIGGTMDPTNMVDAAISVAYPAATQGHGLSAAENGPHTHTGSTNTTGNHTHSSGVSSIGGGGGVANDDDGNPGATKQTGAAGDHNHSFTTNSSGSGTPHTHDIGGSTTTSATMTPRYARGILMKLDA